MTGNPQLGDFFVVTHGRSIIARGIEWATGSPAYHAGIYVGEWSFTFGQTVYDCEPAVFEGRPGGAGFAPLSLYPDAVWSTDGLHNSAGVPITLTDAQRAIIVDKATHRAPNGMLGVSYGWINCFCIGLARLFKWHATRFMRKVLASRKHAECAQLVAILYTIAGVDLFVDGRPEGLVSPANLLTSCLGTLMHGKEV
ncbi:MAG TPA: hypothetical protein VGH54_21180 [Mycobacterium sp.]|jgi:hypothetical protein|uniref:hypothetical protein n=1 Tax=Mycobacterium sp. TaxID=1785 RepID=UPI002F4179A3